MLGGTEGTLAPTSAIMHLSCFLLSPTPHFVSTPPLPLPSVHPPPPGATRPRSNGDPPSRQPTHCARDTRTGRAPVWWGNGGDTPGMVGHKDWEDIRRGQGATSRPSALCILAGIGTLGGWHRVPLLPPMITPSPFAQQSVLFKKYMRIQKKEFITNFPYCAHPLCPKRCQPPRRCHPSHGANSPRWGSMWKGDQLGVTGMSGTPPSHG